MTVRAGSLSLTRGEIPDVRVLRRLAQLITLLSACAEGTLAQALGSWAALKGAYRCFANPRLTPALILQSARPDCLARIAALPRVLLVQDTTTLDFTHHPATRDLGPVGTGQQWGCFAHSALAVDPDAALPLGLAAQRLWCRDPDQRGRAASRRQRALPEKESGRWLAVERASLAGIPASTQTVTVADAEADIFAWFAAPRPAHAFLLVRAAQPHRQTTSGRSLLAPVAAAPVAGRYGVELQATPRRRARTALCSVRVATVDLRPPRNQRDGSARSQPVTVTAILVREQDPPVDGEPLCWLLLTTLAVASFVDACQCISWYTLRWLVERYHYVLKSGCRVEALQLQQAARLERAVAVYSLVAVQVLVLTYLPREQPALACTVALSEAEWQTLYRVQRPQAPLPASPPPLAEAVRLVAQLGGFLGRRGDGVPGPLSVWRGLVRLKDLTAGWHLAHQTLPLQDVGNP
jgi:hypothetical protein